MGSSLVGASGSTVWTTRSLRRRRRAYRSGRRVIGWPGVGSEERAAITAAARHRDDVRSGRSPTGGRDRSLARSADDRADRTQAGRGAFDGQADTAPPGPRPPRPGWTRSHRSSAMSATARRDDPPRHQQAGPVQLRRTPRQSARPDLDGFCARGLWDLIDPAGMRRGGAGTNFCVEVQTR